MQTDAFTSTPDSQSPEDVRRKAEETAQTVVDQVQHVTSTQANSQMTRAADLLDGVVQSIQQTSQSMREQQPQVASLADEAALRVEGVSNYLRNTDLNGVIGDAQSYARREPLIFLGAAFAVGFIAARFLKASAPDASNAGDFGTRRSGLPGYGADYDYEGRDVTRGSRGGYGSRSIGDFGNVADTAYSGSAWGGGSAALADR